MQSHVKLSGEQMTMFALFNLFDQSFWKKNTTHFLNYDSKSLVNHRYSEISRKIRVRVKYHFCYQIKCVDQKRKEIGRNGENIGIDCSEIKYIHIMLISTHTIAIA